MSAENGSGTEGKKERRRQRNHRNASCSWPFAHSAWTPAHEVGVDSDRCSIRCWARTVRRE